MSYSPLDSFIFLTNRVGRLLANAVRRQVGDGVMAQVFPHLGVLVDLWATDGLRQQELAISLIKDKGTIARSLDMLESKGMVERRADPEDKRTNRIFLTEMGRRMREELLQASCEVMAQSVEGIPADELHICREVLQRMYGNLNAELKTKANMFASPLESNASDSTEKQTPGK